MSHILQMRGPYVGIAVLLLAGCSSEDLGDLVDKVKEKTSEATDQVKAAVEDTTTEMQQQLNLAGKIELTLGTPVTTDACYGVFIPPGSRPGVFQLKSYPTTDQEEFPSVFVQAAVTVESVDQLVGQVISARVFVQRQDAGPVWSSGVASPVELRVASIADQRAVVEVVSGSLTDTSGGNETPLTGNFEAILK